MLFPIERLLSGREAPLCVHDAQTIREALSLMVEHDYSQLPIIDSDGELIGIISDELITHRYYHLNGGVALLDLTVDHCLKPAVTLTKDRDIFEALDLLKNVYAIIVTDDNRPVGILTEFDMAHFFRNLTEDLLIVEDIETSLRQVVNTSLGHDVKLTGALINTFGEDTNNPGEPRRRFDDLTLGNLIYLITNDKNWPSFDEFLHPQEMFRLLMEEVRKIRNQLAHFRGELDRVQHDKLKSAQNWLESRPKLKHKTITKIKQSELRHAQETRSIPGTSKYEPMKSFLDEHKAAGEKIIQMTFKDIENLLGFELPPSAREHRAWWANDYSSHPHARAWLGAGWLVDSVDQSLEQVSFRVSPIARYPLFFDDLLTRLKTVRPGITGVKKAGLQNWLTISSGVAGLSYDWSLPVEPVIRVELYVDTGDHERNKARFDKLYGFKDEVEAKIGVSLKWDRMEHARACRIFVTTPFTFNDPVDQQEEAKEWAVKMLLAFFDSFKDYLRSVI